MVINICAAANSKYVRYLYIMLLSVLENNTKNDIRVYILQRDFTDGDKSVLYDLFKAYDQQINIVQVDVERFNRFPTKDRYSIETYFRLAILDVLPADLDRVIYLDVDMIIRGDISELYSIPLEGYYFAACQDMIAFELLPEHRELFNRYDDLRYFNAGMMLWNLKELRKKVSFDVFYEAAKELDFELPCVDQDVLNYKYFDKTLYIDPHIYNFMASAYLRDEWKEDGIHNNALILHFTGVNPWIAGPKCPLYSIWWDYAKKTPFYVELLEEQLKRTEEYIFDSEKSGRVPRPDVDIVNRNLGIMIRLMGKQAFNDYFKEDYHYCLYGAGYQAHCFMELLDFDKIAYRIEGIIDREIRDPIKGVNVYQDYSWMKKDYRYCIILTPSYDTDLLRRQVDENAKGMGIDVEVVTLSQCLKDVEDRVVCL